MKPTRPVLERSYPMLAHCYHLHHPKSAPAAQMTSYRQARILTQPLRLMTAMTLQKTEEH
jgi:hypothetical protein